MAKRSGASEKSPSSQLKELLAALKLPTFMLITAHDRIRLERIEKRIQERLKDASMQSSRLRGDDLDPEALNRLGDDQATLSLFSGPRLYTIHGLSDLSASNSKLLAELLGRISPDNTFLLLSEPLLASNPVVQAAKSADVYLPFPRLEGDELLKWTVHECTTAGFAGITPALAQKIIDLAENSPDRIAAAVSQLELYLGGEPLTTAAIDELFPGSAAAGEFELIDNIMSGNPARTEVLFETLVSLGKSPFMLLGMIAKIFGNYHSIRALLGRQMPPPAIRESLGMNSWVFNKSLDAAKRLSPSDLERHVAAIVRADSKLKNRSLGAEAIFSELLAVLRPQAPSERNA